MPPIASVSPSLTTTCVMAVRLLMLGMGPAAELMSSPLELFSTLTSILTRVMSPASRITVGVTSSLSRASLNWTCVRAERVQDEVDVELPADDPEGDGRGAKAGE